MANILILDDEKNIRSTLSSVLSQEGHEARACGSVAEARTALGEESFELAILDIKLPDGTGLDIFREIRSSRPDTPVIVITGEASIAQALEAVQLGAHQILEKPLSLHRIRIAVRNALLLRSSQRSENDYWATQDERYRMIGRSNAFNTLREKISKVAPTQSRVLITGESGTGKELAAYAIHRQSSRKAGPFVRFNVAAIPRELVESELFGHEKGAFTGAVNQKIGKFEQADGGTLFLDEIGDMEMPVQAKILRVLQESEFERVGGNRVIRANVRVVAATNHDLQKLVKNGDFREDLFFRLNVYPLQIPPLRERKEDIPELVEFFSQSFCLENGWNSPQWSADAVAAIQAHPFPGNIRELKNTIDRLLLEFQGTSQIAPDMISAILGDRIQKMDSGVFSKTMLLSEAKRLLEKQYIETQLQKCGWNITATAKSLGMEQPNLSKKIKLLGIRRPA